MTNIKELSTKCNIISKEQIDERQGARGSSKIYILSVNQTEQMKLLSFYILNFIALQVRSVTINQY
ncbi:hypothetical protein [Enterococcus cecorum]|uniref:hypothetical protein n=1 Tax=Enterococcus cecorum TaxID=44008 RepID=UPI0032658E13